MFASAAAALTAAAGWADDFRVDARVERISANTGRLTVTLGVPAGYLAYADAWSVTAAPPAVLVPESLPAPEDKLDPILGETRSVFAGNAVFTYTVPALPVPLEVAVGYMGCSETLCFPPEEKVWRLVPDGEIGALPDAAGGPAAAMSAAGGWLESAQSFTVAAVHAGYLDSPDFLAFLKVTPSVSAVRRGVVWTMFLILVGGLALNLTPCVLPMIPINLAILGAGAGAGGGRRGFGLGLLYGAGMSLAYGAVGLVAVLTGTAFGSLNASPAFNIGIAVLFAVLALSMFGVFSLDFSGLQARVNVDRLGAGRAVTAFVMGAIAALLAGACVAPVVISVLVLTANLYAAGKTAALVLPFLLGAGMALPWPLVGAGLAVLPRPGRWMEWVKVGFGVMILGFAAYYAWIGYGLLRTRRPPPPAVAGPAHDLDADGWHDDLALGLADAQRQGRPVFLDFWATWCKSCALMERTTFRDPEVRRALEPFVKIRYQAEFPNQSPARDVMRHFGVRGLPTFLILNPRPAGPAPREKEP